MFPRTSNDLFSAKKILPPFLGEMGYEVRYFIALIEPYLRSGWKLISNRSSLYPEKSTIQIPELYIEIDKIKFKYQAESVHNKLLLNFGGLSSSHERSIANAKFEKEIRSLILEFIDDYGRTITPLDKTLTSAWAGLDDQALMGYHGLVPSYKPLDYLLGGDCPKHIGVQFRRFFKKDIHRNSDTNKLYPLLQELSAMSNLPLFVYGDSEACFFPNDCLQASSYHPKNLNGLAGDLRCLKSCEIMFAPDSGWADLMCWLQVPTILQKLNTNYTYFPMIPFKPILTLLKENISLYEQLQEIKKLKPGTIELTSERVTGSMLIPDLFDLRKVLKLQ
jgi:hypothetical protein